MQEKLDSRKYIVAIRDSKTEVFGPLVSVVSLSEAERMFGDLCTDKSCTIGRHPEDYSLWCLARYDECTGIVSNEGGVSVVITGRDFLKE